MFVPAGHLVQESALISELKLSDGHSSQLPPAALFRNRPGGQTEIK